MALLLCVSDSLATNLPDEVNVVKPEFDNAIYDVYRRIASAKRKVSFTRLPTINSLRKKATSSRGAALVESCEALLQGDQSRFGTSISAAIDEFLKKEIGGPTPIEWIANHESCLMLFAESLGLGRPSLTEKQCACILTAESTGLR